MSIYLSNESLLSELEHLGFRESYDSGFSGTSASSRMP